jgi:signal transduction histidine kinase
MKITTKVVLGFALIVLILVGTYLYQARLVANIQRADHEASEVGFQTGLTAMRAHEQVRVLEEFTYKYRVTTDPFYQREVDTLRSTISDDMMSLLRSNLVDEEMRSLVVGIVEDWATCEKLLDRPDDTPPLPEDADTLLEPVFQRLFERLELLFRSSGDFLSRTAARSAVMRDRITWASRTAAAVALFLAISVSVLTYRSISVSLKELIQASRSIASGDFQVHITESRGDELSELAEAMNRMSRRLGELDQLKKDFVSHVSHDLRAPLASIQETTRLLLDELSEGLDESQRRLLELNLASGVRLSRMIGDLLDLSRIEAGSVDYEFERIEVEQVLQESADSLHGLCLEKNLKVVIDSRARPPTRVNADRLSLLQAFGNVLSNAVAYSPRGERIDVLIEPIDGEAVLGRNGAGIENPSARAGQAAAFCRVAIIDRGPGIAPDERAKIFEKFYRSSKLPKGSHPGTGLGLAIARRIIEAHGGSIWVEDAPGGRGSLFSVALPVTEGA